ncbi:MAG: DUF5943 domain-containing protein [Pseudomonadota bacterium]|nr:DUF5943 domain-containing protein [Pseudomonadota bacterium]
MAELPVPVEFDPETGRWSVEGQAMLLIPRHFFVFMQMESEKRFGVEATHAVIHEATCKAAKLWCKREAKTHGIDGVAVFRHYLRRLSERGYGRLTIETIDPAAGTASIRLDHSVYVAEYGRNAGRRVCYMFTSAFIGAMDYVAEAAGRKRDFVSEEVQCGAEGADCCRFVVRPRMPDRTAPAIMPGIDKPGPP